MSEEVSDFMTGRSVGKARMPIERLLSAIGYPERMSGGSAAFTLRVDGSEVAVEEIDGRVVLSFVLTNDETLLPTLAAYAAGRMLREDATLSCGNLQTSRTPNFQAFLWQDVPSDADDHAMLRFFETFMNSCDWWRSRVEALRGNEGERPSETMMIRP